MWPTMVQVHGDVANNGASAVHGDVANNGAVSAWYIGDEGMPASCLVAPGFQHRAADFA